MKQSKPIVLVVAVLAVSSVSSPRARACVLPPQDLDTVALPFDGATVPKNASLRAPTLEAFSEEALTVVAPDGAVVDARWVEDGSGARLEIDGSDDGLAVGHWEAGSSSEIDGVVTYHRPFSFDVVDSEDTEAPALPALHAERQKSSLGCGSGASNLLLGFDDGSGQGDIALLVVQPGDLRIAVGNGGGSIETYDDIAGEITVTAIDFAGNVSAASTVQVEGAGCASVPAASMSALAGLLLLVRRRRSSSGKDTPPAPKKLARRQSPKRLSLRAR